ncbi:hypothetical protein FRC07_013903 [Ceratobasidium sp. 392]|nr:hypothetical protein FRC07_013903 [Ceratobasidium sp. 392]
MAGLPAACFMPVGLDILARRLAPTARYAARALRWPYSSVSAPFTLAEPHNDPSLRALYEPYPSEIPNADLFELEDSSYDRVPATKARVFSKHRALSPKAIASALQPSHTARSNALLVRCITQDDYAGAISLRRDLDTLHTPITHNAIYAKVARHLFDNPDQSNPDSFLEWCELVPDVSNPWSRAAETSSFVGDIFDRLLQSPEDINIICRFSILAARKGMVKQIAIPAISHVTRYSPPETASKLLSDITKAAVQSAAHSHSPSIPRKVMRSWNSTFIRAFCLSGRINAAHQSLLALHSCERTVTPFTYRLVAEELEILGQVKEAEHVRMLSREAGFPSFQSPSRTPSPRTTVPMPPGTVYHQLRWIKRRIDAGRDISTNDLASFMKSYISTGHSRVLPLLRNRLIRLSHNHRWKYDVGLWGTAEIQLYRSQGKHEEVLRVYQSIFLPIGITNQLVNKLGVARPLVSPLPEISSLLWPPSEAIALASWSAAFLAASREDYRHLELCYTIFLEACSPVANSLFQLPPAMKPDAAAFQPWIGAFARMSGPEGIVRIMGDMKRLGIPPSVMTWNALAKAYVANSSWDVAKLILAEMEASRDQITPNMTTPAKSRLRNRLGPVANWGFPAAGLSTYYIILRELWMTKQVPAARELVDMLRRSGYKSGDQRLDSFINIVNKNGDS